VMVVVYLVFNEGYSASFGKRLVRHELCEQAIRLGRMLVELLPAHAEPKGLLALMLLHDSRRDARVDAAGELVLLEDQDRSRWNRDHIAEGLRVLERALSRRRVGAYQLQAAIAAVHARAGRPEETDWGQVAELYSRLAALDPSPVVELNRAVAIAMAEGPEQGLALIDRIDELGGYHLLHAARADLLRRLDRREEAKEAYAHALELATQPAERSFLARRLESLR
jgi:RNA polymerase sigma-70 factor, ECF subfamily